MRRFKRWYRFQLYCLGRWLMHRYEKPLAFDPLHPVEISQSYQIGVAMRELAKPRRLEIRKVSGLEAVQILEGQET